MDMQGAFQLGLHDRGDQRVDTAGWPDNLKIQEFPWLFSKHTTALWHFPKI